MGLQRHGALAQYCAVPASACASVEGLGLTAEVAALMQPMSIAVHAFRRGRLSEGDEAVVIGIGGIGAFLTYAAAAAGSSVVAADLDEDRLRLARALGAEHTVLVREAHFLAEAPGSTQATGTVLFEVTGSEGGLRAALGAMAPEARLVVESTLFCISSGTCSAPG